MPSDMYFRYTRPKGGTPDLKIAVSSLRRLFISRNLKRHEASSSCIHATKESDVPSKVIGNSAPGLRRTSSSLGRTWDEMVAESVATVLVIQAHSSSISSSKSEPFDSIEQPDESSESLAAAYS
ncbi:hypothetical protein Peur_013549 [Populus x canadensis]